MPEASAPRVVVIVDVANVMGSRPDGWWRDRAGAAVRLMAGMPALVGRAVTAPGSAGPADAAPADAADSVEIGRIVAVLEGAAKAADAPVGIDVVRAPADGDGSIVAAAREVADAGESALVVTADRGLRARLGDGTRIAGPGWLNLLLGR